MLFNYPTDTPSPLSDSKSGHTLSPPAVGSMHRQRSATLGAERSKENQHFNRSLHDDRDWVAKETGIGEHHSIYFCEHAHADSSAYYHSQAVTVREIDFSYLKGRKNGKG